MIRGGRFCGRFAQARGNSTWARSFNANLTQQRTMFDQNRMFASVCINMRQCAGEAPMTGFAEQYRSMTQSVSIGQPNASQSDVVGDADASAVSGTQTDELEFVQITEVPTLFTYCDNHVRKRM